jgi:anti-sigma B factor antagonist
MTTSLNFSTERLRDGTIVLAAAGEIDMSNADTFATALAGARQETGSALVVDLTAVEYLDSAGLAALFPHVEHLRLLATPLLAPLLTIVGLDDITTVHNA